MKKILIIFLLGIMTTFAQTTKVKGVTLSYNKKEKSMTLFIQDDVFKYPDNSDLETEIKIRKNFELSMIINGQEYSVTDPYNNYFYIEGFRHPMFYAFTTERPGNCTIVKEFKIYKFTKVEPGEYILVVSKVCDGKYVEEKSTGSIIVE